MKMELANFSKLAKKAATAAAGIIVACLIMLAAIAPSPPELFGQNDFVFNSAPQVAVANEHSAGVSSAPGRFDRLSARLRRVFLARPSVVRGLVLLLLWTIGKVLLTLLSTLFAALSPVWQVMLGVFLNALLLFGLFVVVYKLLFPNKRLRDLFTKRNVILLSCASILFAAVDAGLRVYWEDYRPISLAVKLVLVLGVLIFLSRRIYGKRKPWPVPAVSS